MIQEKDHQSNPNAVVSQLSIVLVAVHQCFHLYNRFPYTKTPGTLNGYTGKHSPIYIAGISTKRTC